MSINTKPHVLFIQHAGALGGSVISLRHLLAGLVSSGARVSVALVEPSTSVRTMYEQLSATVFDTPDIPLFRHTTAGWAHLGDVRSCWYAIRAWAMHFGLLGRIRQLLDRVRPDIVHLNSVTLAYCAPVVQELGYPVVWHVREEPVRGYTGLRTRFLRRTLMTACDEAIFLSSPARDSWVAGARGVVMPNVVPYHAEISDEELAEVRREYGIRPEHRVVCYLGGLAEIKGIFPLIDAITILQKTYPTLRVLMPNGVVPASRTRGRALARGVLASIGLEQDYQRAARHIAEYGLESTIVRRPFTSRILPVIAASEFLVFPSVQPHFARPVVEAAVIAKASIGSDLTGVRELIIDEHSGRLVASGNSVALAESIASMLDEPERVQQMGIAARDYALRQFDADTYVARMLDLYDSLIMTHETTLAQASRTSRKCKIKN